MIVDNYSQTGLIPYAKILPNVFHVKYLQTLELLHLSSLDERSIHERGFAICKPHLAKAQCLSQSILLSVELEETSSLPILMLARRRQ